MKNEKIIVVGGSGFIGKALSNWFGKDNEVVILTRNSKDANNLYSHKQNTDNLNVRSVSWDGKSQGAWAKELEGASLVINLCGKSVKETGFRFEYPLLKGAMSQIIGGLPRKRYHLF